MKELTSFEIEQVAGAGAGASAALAELAQAAAVVLPSDPLAASAYVNAMLMREQNKREAEKMMAEIVSKL